MPGWVVHSHLINKARQPTPGAKRAQEAELSLIPCASTLPHLDHKQVVLNAA